MGARCRPCLPTPTARACCTGRSCSFALLLGSTPIFFSYNPETALRPLELKLAGAQGGNTSQSLRYTGAPVETIDAFRLVGEGPAGGGETGGGGERDE